MPPVTDETPPPAPSPALVKARTALEKLKEFLDKRHGKHEPSFEPPDHHRWITDVMGILMPENVNEFTLGQQDADSNDPLTGDESQLRLAGRLYKQFIDGKLVPKSQVDADLKAAATAADAAKKAASDAALAELTRLTEEIALLRKENEELLAKLSPPPAAPDAQ